MADCLFCSIIAGTTPAQIVLDTPDVVGFLDVRPVFKGHTLLVPREHVPTMVELPDELIGAAVRRRPVGRERPCVRRSTRRDRSLP